MADVLIETVLSQNTSDTNSHRAFLSLKERFPRWEMLADADTSDIAESIRTGGLATRKSLTIKRLVKHITGKWGQRGLDFLIGLPREEAYQLLLDIKGVGPKTAACTLLFGAGIPVFPVDTHIHRVSSRLGWAGKKEGRAEFQERFRKLVPDRMVYPLHINLIEHGRKVCHPHKPKCPTCCLNKLCKWEDKTDEEPGNK